MFTQEKLTTWYYFFNIVAPIITSLGILVSFFISVKTLKEIKRDRVFSQKPFLMFKVGGYEEKVVYERIGKKSPGFNPTYIESEFKDMPNDAISILRDCLSKEKTISTLGDLMNCGNGTAFEVEIVWVPKMIWLNGEKFVIDKEKSNEPKYNRANNTRRVWNYVLPPKEETGIVNWPMFIEKDYNLQITRVEGYFEIHYQDLLKNKYNTLQRFHIFTYYQKEIPSIHVTFCNVFHNSKEWENIT